MARRSKSPLRPAALLASALCLAGVADATLAAAQTMVGAATPAVPAAGGNPQPRQNLYLQIVLNGRDTQQIVPITRVGTRFQASAASLRQLGFRLPRGAAGDIDLNELQGVSMNYDEATQRLSIDTPASMVDQDPTLLNPLGDSVPNASASPGVLLNYDLHGSHDNFGASTASMATELRTFAAGAVISNTALAHWTTLEADPIGNHSVRLDTTLSRSFPARTATFRAGDVVSGALDWSRATRLGGLQWQSNFALQPDLISFPVPVFYGQASLPSSVDLYVNGLKQYSGQIPAGPFQLNTTPSVSGKGQATIVMTDALGRQRTILMPFYTSSRLLRAGLNDYSVELGWPRLGYGLRSFEYAPDPAISGSWRHGATDWLTLEGHAEGTAGLLAGGLGTALGLGGAGVFTASWAGSRDRGHTGAQAAISWAWRNDLFNLSLDTRRSLGDYRDVAARYGPAPPQRTERALAGLILGRAGSLGVSYVAQTYAGEPRARFASAYYFKSLGARTSLNLTVNQNLDNHRDYNWFLSLAVALEGGASISALVDGDPAGAGLTLDANRAIASEGGFGWHLRAHRRDPQRGALAEAGYRGDTVQVQAGVQNIGNYTNSYGNIAGAMVVMAGHPFLTRSIDDAFAVVFTDGVAGVPVMLENRLVGSTNSRGLLLVAPLNSYQKNKLAIDPMQFPADTHIDRVIAQVVPADRAGTLVKFEIEKIRAASLVLVDGSGHALAVGSVARLLGSTAAPAVVGYEGMVYLEGLQPHNVVEVTTERGACRVQFDYHHRDGSVPLLGPLTCHGVQP